jgi:hypothetical protein
MQINHLQRLVSNSGVLLLPVANGVAGAESVVCVASGLGSPSGS